MAQTVWHHCSLSATLPWGPKRCGFWRISQPSGAAIIMSQMRYSFVCSTLDVVRSCGVHDSNRLSTDVLHLLWTVRSTFSQYAAHSICVVHDLLVYCTFAQWAANSPSVPHLLSVRYTFLQHATHSCRMLLKRAKKLGFLYLQSFKKFMQGRNLS